MQVAKVLFVCCVNSWLASHLAYVQHIRVAEQRDRDVNLLILSFVSCWWCL